MDTIGKRLRAERERAGISQRELAERVPGLDHSAISRIEGGSRRVVSHELYALGEALGLTTGQLLGVPQRSQALSIAARLGEEARPDYLVPAVERMAQVLEMDDLITRVAGPAPVPAPVEVDSPRSGPAWAQGRALAARARAALGLGVGPAPDLTALLEDRLGAHVVAQPIAGDVHGVCAMDDGTAVVLVNTNDVWSRQRFTMAHEMAHLLRQDLELYEVTGTVSREAVHERRADAFAAHFLAPDDGIRSFVGGRPVTATVVAELMDYFEVSMEAMCWRLVNTGLLTKDEAAGIQKSGARGVLAAANLERSFDERARAHERVTSPPRKLLRRAVAAYQAGEVGAGVVSAVLGEGDVSAVRSKLESEGITPPPPNASAAGASLV